MFTVPATELVKRMLGIEEGPPIGSTLRVVGELGRVECEHCRLHLNLHRSPFAESCGFSTGPASHKAM